MDVTGVELPQANNAESVKAQLEGNLISRIAANIRRKFLRKPQDTQPKTPEVSLEQLNQDLINLEDIRKRGGSDFNSPETRAQDDVRMEQLRATIASRTSQPQVETQPTVTPTIEKPAVAPGEPPAEEQRVA